MNETLIDQLSNLTTPHLADGCLRTNVPIRFAPANRVGRDPDYTFRKHLEEIGGAIEA